MGKIKEEQIFIQIDDEIIELIGEDKKEFIAKREELLNLQYQQKAQRELKISAYKKLGLTDEEIAAIV